MSIQASINQSLGTLGIAAGLYQQTPQFKARQVRAQSEKLTEEANAAEWRENARKILSEHDIVTGERIEVSPEQQAENEARLAETKRVARQARIESAELFKQSGDYATYSRMRADLAASGDLIDERQEQFDALQERLKKLENLKTGLEDIVKNYEQRKGGNK